jgi:hypothetical protein
MKSVEIEKPVTGLAPITPSTSTPDYVSMKNAGHLTIYILADNSTSVTGSAITLKQATAVAGTSEKALGFSHVWANEDTGAGDTLTKTTVTSDTFTTDDTDNKNLLYVIEIDAEDLDTDNGFDCVRVGTGDASGTVLSVLYVLKELRYKQSTPPAAITD